MRGGWLRGRYANNSGLGVCGCRSHPSSFCFFCRRAASAGGTPASGPTSLSWKYGKQQEGSTAMVVLEPQPELTSLNVYNPSSSCTAQALSHPSRSMTRPPPDPAPAGHRRRGGANTPPCAMAGRLRRATATCLCLVGCLLWLMGPRPVIMASGHSKDNEDAAAASRLAVSKHHSAPPRHRPPPRHRLGAFQASTVRKDLLSSCELKWRNATLDHFSFVNVREPSLGVEGGTSRAGCRPWETLDCEDLCAWRQGM